MGNQNKIQADPVDLNKTDGFGMNGFRNVTDLTKQLCNSDLAKGIVEIPQ